MQFCSTEFLFLFLPVFLAVYYIFPSASRNGILLIGSIGFYYFGFGGQLWQTAVLLGLVLSTYMMGFVLARWPDRGWLRVFLGILVGVLAFFKLFANGALLPPGLSFFLFQMAAYLIEIHRNTFSPEQGLVCYGAQILMFPKLLSGPLCDPKELLEQTAERKFSAEQFHHGLQQLILGIAMKTILADRLGGLWSQAGIMGYDAISTVFAWMALICWVLRLYLDFFAYSLMAVGLGQMLGFRLPRNFLDPYCAGSVSEFYRRWHATLGAWFRNYVYIPLGGNRYGMFQTIVNLFIVWLLTGLWHGIGWGYLLWAGMVWLLIVLERLFLGKLLKKCRPLGHIYTPIVITLSWVPFAVVGLRDIGLFFGKLFGLGAPALNPMDFLSWTGQYLPLMAGGLILCTPWPERLWHKIRRNPISDVILFCLFWAAMFLLATESADPFLYFQF